LDQGYQAWPHVDFGRLARLGLVLKPLWVCPSESCVTDGGTRRSSNYLGVSSFHQVSARKPQTHAP
jgi:hypothetical protein